MWYLLGAILWVIFAFWPAIVARSKGHSFVLFFLLSLVFFFLSVALAYMVSDKTATAQDKADQDAVNKVLEREENAG